MRLIDLRISHLPTHPLLPQNWSIFSVVVPSSFLFFSFLFLRTANLPCYSSSPLTLLSSRRPNHTRASLQCHLYPHLPPTQCETTPLHAPLFPPPHSHVHLPHSTPLSLPTSPHAASSTSTAPHPLLFPPRFYHQLLRPHHGIPSVDSHTRLFPFPAKLRITGYHFGAARRRVGEMVTGGRWWKWRGGEGRGEERRGEKEGMKKGREEGRREGREIGIVSFGIYVFLHVSKSVYTYTK